MIVSSITLVWSEEGSRLAVSCNDTMVDTS
jgi:hypothetical protein